MIHSLYEEFESEWGSLIMICIAVFKRIYLSPWNDVSKKQDSQISI